MDAEKSIDAGALPGAITLRSLEVKLQRELLRQAKLRSQGLELQNAIARETLRRMGGTLPSVANEKGKA